MKKYIFGELILLWILAIMGALVSFETKDGKVILDIGYSLGTIFLLTIAIFQTFKWGRIGICCLVCQPHSLVTKGWRRYVRDSFYVLHFHKHFCYSIVEFTDPRLPGKYIYLDNRIFKSGDQLKITYYPRSKYIKAIEKVEEIESNCPK